MAFKPPATLPDYTKLITSLNASGVQSWNPELHSILKQLISSAQQSQDAVTGVPPGSPVGVIDIGGGGGSSGSEIEYLGDIALPKVYNDGDIVVGTDGIAYLCTKDGTTTVPTVWPGGGGLTGPQGPPGVSSSVFNYRFDATATTPNDPGAGKIRFNNATQNLVTVWFVDWLTADGFDAHVLFEMATLGDQVILQDTDLAVNNQTWKLTGPATNHPDWFEIPVQFVSGNTNWTNNQKITALLHFQSTVVGPHHTTHEPGGTDPIQNAAWTNLGNIFTVNQRITKSVPILEIVDPTALVISRFGRVSKFDGTSVSTNLIGDGTGHWTSDDPNATGILYIQELGQHNFYISAPSVDPRTIVAKLQIGTNLVAINPNLQINGNTTAAGNILVTKIIPEIQLQYTGVTAKVHLLAAGSAGGWLTHNLSFDGTNWNRDDTTLAGGFLTIQQSTLFFRVAPVGANPASSVLNTLFNIDSTGLATFSGNIIEKNRSVPIGHWIDVPFNAANFTASGGTWTPTAGQVRSNRYTLIGKTAIYNFSISDSSTTGGSGILIINNPVSGFEGSSYSSALVKNATTLAMTFCSEGDTNIYIVKSGFAAWGATTGDINLTLTMYLK